MGDRESLIRLGRYLGVIRDPDIARRLEICPELDQAGKWLLAAAGTLKKILNDDGAGETIKIICSTDYDSLLVTGVSPADSLSRHVYDELRKRLDREAEFSGYDNFRQYFYQFLHRVEMTLRGALYTAGIKKEIVDLANPAAFDAIDELRHLTGRKFGETSPMPGNVRQVTTVVRYVQILLDRYEEKCIGRELCRSVREILGRLSSYPWYFTMLEQRKKSEAARPLTRALEVLKDAPGEEQDKQDLITALAIILFNILPSPELVKYIATLRPGPGNRYLQHEYFAVLALNFLLTGKTALAAKFTEKACEVAPEADMKAYDYLLSGCIKVHMREYEEALKAFDLGLGPGSRKTRALIKFYTGILQYELGDARLAIECFRDSRAGSTDECDTMTLGNNVGTCYMALGNLESALNAFEEAERAFPYTGRLTARQMRTVTYNHMGIIYMSMREFDLAAANFKKALRAAREAGSTQGVADQLINIGLASKGKHEYALAANYFTSALNYSCSIDYVEGVLYSREQLRQALALDCRYGDIRPIERDVIRRHPRFYSLLMARRW